MKKISKFDALMLKYIFKHAPWLTPNHLTILRIPAPAIVVPLYICGYAVAAWIVFVLAAITDLFDGSLARSRGPQTDWGKEWDQKADKLLVNSTIGVFCFLSYWNGSFTFDTSTTYLIVVPFILTIIRDYLVNEARKLGAVRYTEPLRSAKYKATIQMFAAGSLLLADQSLVFYVLGYALMPTATALAVYSGYLYLFGNVTRPKAN